MVTEDTPVLFRILCARPRPAPTITSTSPSRGLSRPLPTTPSRGLTPGRMAKPSCSAPAPELARRREGDPGSAPARSTGSRPLSSVNACRPCACAAETVAPFLTADASEVRMRKALGPGRGLVSARPMRSAPARAEGGGSGPGSSFPSLRRRCGRSSQWGIAAEVGLPWVVRSLDCA